MQLLNIMNIQNAGKCMMVLNRNRVPMAHGKYKIVFKNYLYFLGCMQHIHMKYKMEQHAR